MTTEKRAERRVEQELCAAADVRPRPVKTPPMSQHFFQVSSTLSLFRPFNFPSY